MAPDPRYYLEHTVAEFLDLGDFDSAEARLLSWDYLDGKARAGLGPSLAADFARAARELPDAYDSREDFALFAETVRRDLQFLSRHPGALFQCLWNACAWQDSDLEEQPGDEPPYLRELLEHWKVRAEERDPGFCWVRSLLPPVVGLGTPLVGRITGHTWTVTAVAASPDGRLLATAGKDKMLRLWDAASGAAVRTVEVKPHPLESLAFSPDGRHLVGSLGGNAHRVWVVESGQELYRLRGKVYSDHDLSSLDPGVCRVLFLPDGRHVAAMAAGFEIRMVDAPLNRDVPLRVSPVQSYPGSPFARTLALRPDGRLVGFAAISLPEGQGTVTSLWDLRTGEELWKGPAPPDDGNIDWRLSADAGLLAATWTEYRESPEQDHPGLDSLTRLRCWEVGSGREVLDREIPARVHFIREFQRAGTRALLHLGDALVVFDTAGQDARVVQTGHNSHLQVSPGGRHYVLADLLSARLWDVEGGEVLELKDLSEQAFAFSPDGRLLAWGRTDDTVSLYDLRHKREAGRLVGHEGRVASVVFSHDGTRLLTGAEDGGVRVWDPSLAVSAGAGKRELLPSGEAVAFSPDGNLLAVGGRGEKEMVRLWDVSACREREPIARPAISLSFTPQGRLLLGGEGEVDCYDVSGETPFLVWRFPQERPRHPFEDILFGPRPTLGTFEALAVSGNGQVMAAGTATGLVILLDPNGEEIARFPGQEYEASLVSLSLSGDGSTLALGTRGGIIWLWKIGEFEAAHLHGAHKEWVRDIAFSPDGSQLVSTSTDRTTRVWDARRGHCLRVLQGAQDPRPVAAGGQALHAQAGPIEVAFGPGGDSPPVAWYPAQLRDLRCGPSSRLWAGTADTGGLHLLTVEGERALSRSGDSEPEAAPPQLQPLHLVPPHSGGGRAPSLGGLDWQTDDYASHAAICPACGQGNRYGAKGYATELRIYFLGGEPRSLERPLHRLRIKCPCTVGTGKVDGLYLVPLDRICRPDWSREVVREYLRRIGSPLAEHPDLDCIRGESLVQRWQRGNS